jgi:hypothetical protein
MLADIAKRKCAQHRIAERMQNHIAIGMGHQTLLMGNSHTTQYDMIAAAEGMYVETVAYAHVISHSG